MSDTTQIDNLTEVSDRFNEMYMNMAQIRANYIDPNVLFAEWARATGKTEGVFGPRMNKVAYAMPGETSFVVHKTYVALLTNIIPNLKAYWNTPYGPQNRPRWVEGEDYVIGESKLPSHFKKPRYPVSYPKHAIVHKTGHNFQLVASDQPDSVAGKNGVHAFVEEMKHNKGDNLKSRLFPALRGAPLHIRKSHYYQGITGVSDTARIDLGEDAWFEDYEKNTNHELISKIFTAAKYVNDNHYHMLKKQARLRENISIDERNKLTLQIKKHAHALEIWNPRLNRMRINATYYIRSSSFANKDFLGQKFFQTQLETLSELEFMVAICAIRIRQAENLFFVGFDPKQHCYSDGYRYNSILSLDLKDTFTVTADLLRHFKPNEPLLLGYDPGYFQSLVVAQEHKATNELHLMKDFHGWGKKNQTDLAREVYDFFGQHHTNKEILLYYDRAGNKSKKVENQITTDAQIMAKELESYGFRVRLMNEKQRTIYYYEHYKLLGLLLSEKMRHTIRIRLDENGCKDLKSSILTTAVRKSDDRIEMDKANEKKLPWNMQAALSPQLASALTYLIFSRYNNQLPSEMKKTPDLPPTMAI